MRHTIERALPPVARRPGLLQPAEVIDLLSARKNWQATAQFVSECLDRPLDQVLHVLSYMTSMGLVASHQVDGTWHYGLTPAGMGLYTP